MLHRRSLTDVSIPGKWDQGQPAHEDDWLMRVPRTCASACLDRLQTIVENLKTPEEFWKAAESLLHEEWCQVFAFWPKDVHPPKADTSLNHSLSDALEKGDGPAQARERKVVAPFGDAGSCLPFFRFWAAAFVLEEAARRQRHRHCGFLDLAQKLEHFVKKYHQECIGHEMGNCSGNPGVYCFWGCLEEYDVELWKRSTTLEATAAAWAQSDPRDDRKAQLESYIALAPPVVQRSQTIKTSPLTYILVTCCGPVRIALDLNLDLLRAWTGQVQDPNQFDFDLEFDLPRIWGRSSLSG